MTRPGCGHPYVATSRNHAIDDSASSLTTTPIARRMERSPILVLDPSPPTVYTNKNAISDSHVMASCRSLAICSPLPAFIQRHPIGRISSIYLRTRRAHPRDTDADTAGHEFRASTVYLTERDVANLGAVKIDATTAACSLSECSSIATAA